MVVDGITMTNKVCKALNYPFTIKSKLISSFIASRDKTQRPNLRRPLCLPRGLPTNHPYAPRLLHRGSDGNLEVTSALNIGPHYGKTLFAWQDNFLRS